MSQSVPKLCVRLARQPENQFSCRMCVCVCVWGYLAVLSLAETVATGICGRVKLGGISRKAQT